ncbi:MAG: ubiquitin-conjugating enzyme E2 [Candidatus Jordarchaeaceae archaeon]
MQEAKIMEEEEPSFHPVDGDLRRWAGFIIGTGIYDGGVFEIEIILPRKFPYEPPKVIWKTNIWHPNIFQKNVCVNILGKDWLPTMSMAGVVETLRNLLNYPNPNSPLNTEAARQMNRNLEEFSKTAKEYVKKYATWDRLKK